VQETQLKLRACTNYLGFIVCLLLEFEMESTFVLLSFVAGAVLTVQAGANAQLAKAVGSPFDATAVQLFIGAAVLVVITGLCGQFAAFGGLAHVQVWHAVGGTASAFFVASTILLYPRIGAVAAVGFIISGQMLASLALDVFGMLGIGLRGLGAGMAVGAVLMLVGAAAIVISGKSQAKLQPAWLLLAFAAGAVLPVQGAVNSLLRADLGAPMAVGAVSFIVATVAMLLVILAVRLFSGATAAVAGEGFQALPWWGWLGGFAGAAYVTTVFLSIPVIGASATIGLTVAGQQIASLFVDHYGFFRLPKREISAARLAGVALLLGGVSAIQFS
jgi:transporter family-2 protein